MRRSLFENREFLTKNELCDLLDCSVRTVQRMLATGKLTIVRSGTGRFDPIKIERASFVAYIGDVSCLKFDPEPWLQSVANLATHRPSAANLAAHDPEPVPTRPLTNAEQRIADDLKFAEAYRAGTATDSAGNTVHGSNERWPTKGPQSLLGPVDANDRTPPCDTQAHMNPRLLGSTDGKRPNFGQGPSAEQHAAMMADWRRRSGAPSMGEQRERQERSKAIMREAFNYARRSR